MKRHILNYMSQDLIANVSNIFQLYPSPQRFSYSCKSIVDNTDVQSVQTILVRGTEYFPCISLNINLTVKCLE
jgi:hypothetical protein